MDYKFLRNIFNKVEYVIYLIVLSLIIFALYSVINSYLINNNTTDAYFKSKLIISEVLSLSLNLLLIVFIVKIFTEIYQNHTSISYKNLIVTSVLVILKVVITYVIHQEIEESHENL